MHPLIFEAWQLYDVLEQHYGAAMRRGEIGRLWHLTRLLDRAWARFERRCRKFDEEALEGAANTL